MMYVSYTNDWPGLSVGYPVGALALICLWVLWHGWLTLMGCIVKMTLLLESFYSSMCMPILLDWALQLMYVMINYWSLYCQVACWPCLIWMLDHQSFGKSWGVWWLYCESPGHSSTADHSQTFRCLNIVNNYKTSIKPNYKGKMFCWHWWCTYTSSVAIKQGIIKRFGKKPHWGKKSLPVWCCIPVHHSSSITLLYFLGDRVSMHPCEADWTKNGGHYGKARLKEGLHAPPCINNGQHMWSFVIICAQWLWETHSFLTINP